VYDQRLLIESCVEGDVTYVLGNQNNSPAEDVGDSQLMVDIWIPPSDVSNNDGRFAKPYPDVFQDLVAILLIGSDASDASLSQRFLDGVENTPAPSWSKCQITNARSDFADRPLL